MQRISVRSTSGTNPVTLASLKSRLKITTSADDDYLTEILAQALSLCEEITRRCIIRKALTASIDFQGCPPTGSDPWWNGVKQGSILMFTPAYITLLCPPAEAIEQVRTYDINDTMTVYSSSNYRLDKSDPMQYGRLVLAYGAIWPAALRYLNSIEIDFTAGWADGSVPPGITRAIGSIAAWMYANRAACTEQCAEACGAMGELGPFIMMKLGPT